MKVDVLLGLQWGDEGKGKVVDVLTPRYDLIARFQGGPNAGHSLEFNEIKHVLHTIPSGIFHPDKLNVIGNGVVIDPVIFKKEIESLERLGVDPRKNLVLSKKAHLILPSHRMLDAASEHSKGKAKIGSTLKGIGPTYMDKTGRNGIRIGDIFQASFEEKYRALVEKHQQLAALYDYPSDISDQEKEWFAGLEVIKSFRIEATEYLVNEALRKEERVLAEGAQGTLLDIDFGSYPFVTSSNTVTAGACTGLGIAPNKIGKVYGIFKAYCTRVGSGPFPTELEDSTGDLLRKQGNEFGSTTGRPRRTGWLDLVSLKYSCMINGVTDLILTKADVLSDFDSIMVAVAYRTSEAETSLELPYSLEETIDPQYIELPGWKADITQITSENEFPEELNAYLNFIEEYLELPITLVSVGPNRSQIIERYID